MVHSIAAALSMLLPCPRLAQTQSYPPARHPARRGGPTMSRACGAYVGDPYAVLGLELGATAADIRTAFRARARVLHPDVSEDPESSQQFRALCAAVEAIQAGDVFAKISRGPQLKTPPGLSADEQVRWLAAQNKVLLFMRGTKQRPLCEASASAVSTLSWCAFDTNTRFAAVDVSNDAALAEAVLRVSNSSSLPQCFLGGTCVGGPAELDALYESGQLITAFGGEQLLEPKELEWRPGSWEELPEESGGGRNAPMRRAHRNLVSGELEWFVQHEDTIWRAERGFGAPESAPTAGAARAQRPQPPQRQEEVDVKAEDGQQQQQQQEQQQEEAEEGLTAIAAVIAYRHHLRNDQWQVRWRAEAGDEEFEPTWERCDVLDTSALREVAKALRRQSSR